MTSIGFERQAASQYLLVKTRRSLPRGGAPARGVDVLNLHTTRTSRRRKQSGHGRHCYSDLSTHASTTVVIKHASSLVITVSGSSDNKQIDGWPPRAVLWGPRSTQHPDGSLSYDVHRPIRTKHGRQWIRQGLTRSLLRTTLGSDSYIGGTLTREQVRGRKKTAH